MGIFARVSDILTANIQHLLDRAEDPDKMIKQAVREMEEGLRDVRASTAKAIAAEKRLQRELDENRQNIRAWQDRAKQAINSDRDDLAREALTRRREAEKLAARLKTQIEQAKETSETLRQTLGALETRLAEARRKRAALVARKDAAEVKKAIAAHVPAEGAGGRHLGAFAKLEEMERKVEDAEMEADAAAEVSAAQQELEESPPKEGVEIELELMKLKQQKEAAAAEPQV